jgi:tRNA (cytidine/uridine-2'-O-)-methyltransferase
MLHVVLHQPEIPPNTGNVIRLCANTGAQLHLIEPLGFALDDARLKRAGLDYHEYAQMRVHADLSRCRAHLGERRWFALTTKASCSVYATRFADEDVLLFGCETRGLPTAVLDALPEAQRLRLPMRPGSRSLNLSNAVAVVVFEAWRQLDFASPDIS